MSALGEIIKVRTKLRQQRDQLARMRTELLDYEGRIRFLTSRLDAMSESARAHAVDEKKMLTILQEQVPPLAGAIEQLETELTTLSTNHETLMVAEQPLWGKKALFPVALFPIRIETKFVEPAEGRGLDLLVRIYPDEVHRDRSKSPPASAREKKQQASGTQTRLRILPEKWTLYVFRSGELIGEHTGAMIPEDLLGSFQKQQSVRGTKEARPWTVDFDAALKVGMAMRLHFEDTFDSPDATIDLFVLGLCENEDAKTTAERITSTFKVHASEGRLGFVPCGTPTNNTATKLSGWNSQEAIGAEVRTKGPYKSNGSENQENASLFERAFGVGSQSWLSAVSGGTEDAWTAVATVKDALWYPLTINWLERLLWPTLNIEGQSNLGGIRHQEFSSIDQALRHHVSRYVFSRGPLPAIRVAQQPYGLLPVSSLDLWRTSPDDEIELVISQTLQDLLPFWEAGLPNVPRQDNSLDQDVSILNVLARRPFPIDVALRKVMYDLRGFGGDFGEESFNTMPGHGEPCLTIPSQPWPCHLTLTYLFDSAVPRPIDLPLVGDAGALAKRWKKVATMIRERPEISYGELRTAIWGTHMPGKPAPKSKNELSAEAISSLRTINNLFNVLVQQNLGYWNTLAGSVISEGTPDSKVTDALQQGIGRLAELLEKLAAIAPEQYEPLLLETIDIFSRRFDAWATSLATKRLDEMRIRSPKGCHLGGYGWVENLAPKKSLPKVATKVGGKTVEATQDPTHTYILAPSLHHATTAAVLRSGFESHTDREAFAMRLTSKRVRIARSILEGIRNGQPLGALLGYRFERGLHDCGKDVLIAQFRKAYPIPMASQSEPNGAGAQEAIAAENVVDGLSLYRKGLPDTFKNDKDVVRLFADLGDAIDAVGDILLAESVHQLVGGNSARAGIAADSVGRAEALPNRLDVLRTPQSARSIDCGVAVMLPAGPLARNEGWNRTRPRARMAPEIDRWVGHLLGDPKQWRFAWEVTVKEKTRVLKCRLADLQLCPLDVVFESAMPGSDAQSLLERRFQDRIASSRSTEILRMVPTQPGMENLETLKALAASIRQVIAAAAPLLASDLERGPSNKPPEILTRVLAQRANKILREFHRAVASLRQCLTTRGKGVKSRTTQRLAAALATLSRFGIQEAYPLPMSVPVEADSPDSIVHQSQVVLARIQAMKIPPTIARFQGDSDGLSVQGWLESTSKLLRTLLGEQFPIVAPLRLTSSSEFSRSLADKARPSSSDASDAMAWLGRLSLVRARIKSFHEALSAGEALNITKTPSLFVTQSPTSSADVRERSSQEEPWIAKPFTDRLRPKAQRTLIVHTLGPIRFPRGTGDFCGLMIDRWVEQLPGLDALGGINVSAVNKLVQEAIESGNSLPYSLQSEVQNMLETGELTDKKGVPLTTSARLRYSKEQTIDFDSITHAQSEIAGLSFRYDRPDAEPPQAILLAVPPDPARPWTADALLQVVRETLDLAKLRAVDLRDLPRMTPLFPGSYVKLDGFILGTDMMDQHNEWDSCLPLLKDEK